MTPSPTRPSVHHSSFSERLTDVGGEPGDPLLDLKKILYGNDGTSSSTSSQRLQEALEPHYKKILTSALTADDVTIDFNSVSGFERPRDLATLISDLSSDLIRFTIREWDTELDTAEEKLEQELALFHSTHRSASVITPPQRKAHFLTLDTVLSQLEGIAIELDKTRTAVDQLIGRKKKLTADLIAFWTSHDAGSEDDVDDDTGIKTEQNEKSEKEVSKIDAQLTSLQGHIRSLRGGIKSLLSDHYNTPDGDWNAEPKKMTPLKLDPKLTGSPDPTLVESLIVSIRAMLHSHVSQFWACIPFLECMDADREDPEHWPYPCTANRYEGVPRALLETYKTQSAILFQHIWNSSAGNSQLGSQILRKTFGEKFLGDFLNTEASIKSSKHDGMMSVFYLVSIHASAGYQERARLRSTLHHAANMFVSGNPQSKLTAIRLVIDKATTLRVKIDFEATIKPIVMILRQRSPNFNDLATQYLRDQSKAKLNDWDESGLDHLDTLLSEIDFIVTNYGMESSLPAIKDPHSKANEATAIAAFAVYTGEKVDNAEKVNAANTQHEHTGQSKPWTCGAKDCQNTVSAPIKQRFISLRKKLQAQGKVKSTPLSNPICDTCYGKLKSGEASQIDMKRGRPRKLRPRTTARQTSTTDGTDTTNDHKTTVMQCVAELISDIYTATEPASEASDTASQSSTSEDTLDNSDDPKARFRAKWEALGLGK